MPRAPGFGRSLPAPWARWRRQPGSKTGFGTLLLRLAPRVALVALILGNSILIYRLATPKDIPQVAGVTVVPADAGQGADTGSAIDELRERLQDLQASIRASLQRPSEADGKDRAGQSDGSRDGSKPAAALADSKDGSGTSGSSTGSSSTDSGSSGSGSSGSSGGSSDSGGSGDSGGGDSGGGDSGGEDSGGGGGGGGGDSGDSGGDPDGGGGGGGGAG